MLCLQQGIVVNNTSTFLGVHLSTKGLDRKYPWQVYVSAQESGVEGGARVCCDQIYSVPKTWIKRYAYALTPETMREVDKALLRALCMTPENNT